MTGTGTISGHQRCHTSTSGPVRFEGSFRIGEFRRIQFTDGMVVPPPVLQENRTRGNEHVRDPSPSDVRLRLGNARFHGRRQPRRLLRHDDPRSDVAQQQGRKTDDSNEPNQTYKGRIQCQILCKATTNARYLCLVDRAREPRCGTARRGCGQAPGRSSTLRAVSIRSFQNDTALCAVHIRLHTWITQSRTESSSLSRIVVDGFLVAGSWSAIRKVRFEAC
jgi:hypothetical protein